MLDLNFTVETAEVEPHAAAPLLIFKLRIAESVAAEEPTTIPAIALKCQIRIEPARRRYAADEEEKLLDLFGTRERWGHTLRSTLWTHTSVVVPPFTGETVIDLPVPCSFDFNVAATKYFYALADGEVPLCLLFSGTIFYTDRDGYLQVSQIPWEKEASYRLPVQVWKNMMELYYPKSAWLCLERDTFDRLYRYKSSRGLPTWEQAIDMLIDSVLEEVES
ncbi:MAG TPA: DUF6084 family protein [Isosphaeraceae bacterium]|nr:DUF6084 family protein [Isosphaeraceae bacterium]